MSMETNNNPITLLFNLGETALAAMKMMAEKGVLLASDEKAKSRMEVCHGCEFFEKEHVRCKLCGCFMSTKVRIEAAKCPINRW